MINSYFNHLHEPGEQDLIEDLTIEAIQLAGMDLKYLPRTMVSRDDLFGEAPVSRFNGFQTIEFYPNTTDSFMGGDIFTKFNLEVRDSMKLTVARRRFKTETGMDRPLEGDLIYIPVTNTLLEVKFVEHENPFYQLGKLYSFVITCELFQYSEEKFTTGDPKIDMLESKAAYTLEISHGTTSGTGSFSIGDQLYQHHDGTTAAGFSGADAKGTVVSVDSGSVVLKDIIGEWKIDSATGQGLWITKSDNTAYRTVVGMSDIFGTHVSKANEAIETEANEILDFSERHPFGDPD